LEELKGYRRDLISQLNGFHWGFLSESTKKTYLNSLLRFHYWIKKDLKII